MIIKSTKDNSFDNGLKILVYGAAGSGKTMLCSTIVGNPLILSAESGLLSLRGFDIPYIEITNMNSLRSAFEFVYKSEDVNKYDWICIDSLSEIAEVCLTEEIKNSRDPRKAYGELNVKMISLVKAFRDLPGKNVYMSAKLGHEKDESTGALVYSPMMPGRQIGAQLPYLFDEVFMLECSKNEEGEIVRSLITSDDFSAVAKDRSGALNIREEANLNAIKNKIIVNKEIIGE